MKTIGQESSEKQGCFRIEGPQLALFRPHKYPMVLIENVTECNVEEAWLKGTKYVKADDPYVQAHFPGDAFMAPTFVMEALAQAAGALMNIMFYFDRGIRLWEIGPQEFVTLEQPPFNVLAETKIKILGLAFPGDTVTLGVKITLKRKDIIAFHAEASVGDRQIAVGDVMLAYPAYTPVTKPDPEIMAVLNAAG